MPRRRTLFGEVQKTIDRVMGETKKVLPKSKKGGFLTILHRPDLIAMIVGVLLVCGALFVLLRAKPTPDPVPTPVPSPEPAPSPVFSINLGKQGAVCSGTEFYKTDAWDLAPEEGGVKEFDTPEYASWVQEAQKRCVEKDSDCKFVSVWKDAGWRGYKEGECSTGKADDGRMSIFGAGSNQFVDVSGIALV